MARVPKKRTKKESNQQRKRRSLGLLKKAAELQRFCNCDVALFIRNRERDQRKLLIATDDPEWQKQFDTIASGLPPWTVMNASAFLKLGCEEKTNRGKQPSCEEQPKARYRTLEDRLRSLAVPEPPKVLLAHQQKVVNRGGPDSKGQELPATRADIRTPRTAEVEMIPLGD